jgi:CheY-like chemotaxis protein
MGRIVLIVEDDEDIRTTTADILLEEGYSVRLAANGKEALGWLRAGLRPCVILLDLMMPVMSGYEFLKTLRAEAANSRRSCLGHERRSRGRRGLPEADESRPAIRARFPALRLVSSRLTSAHSA